MQKDIKTIFFIIYKFTFQIQISHIFENLSSQNIHALAIVNFWVINCIGFENIKKCILTIFTFF